MSKLNLKSIVPELFLIVSVIYYWILTGNLFNPIAIGLLAVLLYLIFSKKSTLGLLLSIVFIALTLFMVMALISELSEFEEVTKAYNNLLIFGTLYLGINLCLGGVMFLKYLKLKMY